jgi:malonate-semialdehyde dehydrogenase (acetylating)/methylmalonate-semialdehyde dehydrogenase
LKFPLGKQNPFLRTTLDDLVTTLQSNRTDQIEVISPVDGTCLGQVLVSTASDVAAAVERAQKAFAEWGQTPVKERVQPLFRFKQLMEQNIADLSRLVSAESGKTVDEAEAGIRKGLEVVEFATALPCLGQGGKLEVSRQVDCFSRRYPLGVVAGVTPFNFPAMVPLWMYPLAIATGNCFLLKPSEQVPLTSERVAQLLADAGLPEGVFQVVQGDRTTVESLLDHPGIVALAFVGSTRVARHVYQRGVAVGKRVLALGGAKNHLVVVPDADPITSAQNIVASATGCAGQRCMAASVLITVGDCSPVLDAV